MTKKPSRFCSGTSTSLGVKRKPAGGVKRQRATAVRCAVSIARARVVPAISTSAGSTSYAAKSTGAPLYVSRRTATRFHGTVTSRAYSANVRSHFPESGSGRAAPAGAAATVNASAPNVSRRDAREA